MKKSLTALALCASLVFTPTAHAQPAQPNQQAVAIAAPSTIHITIPPFVIPLALGIITLFLKSIAGGSSGASESDSDNDSSSLSSDFESLVEKSNSATPAPSTHTAPPSTPPTATPPSAVTVTATASGVSIDGMTPEQASARTFTEINQARRSAGVRTLRHDSELEQTLARDAQCFATSQKLGHVCDDGDLGSFGEIIYGVGSDEWPSPTVQWERSKDHSAIMYGPNYRSAATLVVYNSHAKMWLYIARIR